MEWIEYSGGSLDEAREEAEHNFEVESERLKSERGFLIPDKKAMMRSDTRQYLGTVGIGWEVVQPVVMYEMAEKVLDSINTGRVAYTLNLRNGAVIGICLHLTTKSFANDDPIDINLLIINAFNGTHSISGYTTAYHRRTESYVNTSNRVFNLRHTKFVGDRIEVVKAMLEYYYKEIDDFSAKIQTIINKPMSDELAIDWFRSLFPRARSQKSERIIENQCAKFMNILLTNGIRRRTCYNAFVSLVEYTNHTRTVRVHNDRDQGEVVFESIHFGTANKLMQKGLDKLLPADFGGFSEDEFTID